MLDLVTARFNEIYDATYTSVTRLIASKCRNIHDIGDLVQETYIELYQILRRHGVEYVRHDKGLAMKLARRKVAKHYAKSKKQPDVMPLDEQTEVDANLDALLTEDFAVNQAMAAQARDILRQQDDVTQKIFALFYDVELTIPQIAKTLSVSQSNVKNKLYRTLKTLRALLEG
ncbi:MAG: sigma-70 family RNA polymerase sigma factor [Oscillospiraceae bacterium]|nr:sigma-70 family RNA polymerase sigma factor [Oscillospiraceae bacterium]